ncbi:hypothetical protein [Desulfocurvus vexinensis]|uniref:hypothetical protein n=1 Tax=Desulfocurvus vexinensis TaxID=399548 RepID=UPI000491C757|nr:hypothetical protein [Desulfocurvus vexinensis]
MLPVLIREGTSGIVEVKGFGAPQTWHPDNDLDKALDLLFTLYEARTPDGVRFQDNYHHEGFNWLSTQVGNLYWRWLFRIVQYGALLEDLAGRGRVPYFLNRLNFARVWEVLHPRRPGPWAGLEAWRLYRRALPAHNRQVAARPGGDLLFYRYGPRDFRTREMLDVFEAEGAPFHFVYSPSRPLFARRHAQGRPVYFLHRRWAAPRIFCNSYDLSGFPGGLRPAVAAIIRRAEEHMSFAVWEYHQHLEALRPRPPRLLFGLEDHQEIYPLLYACRTLGVPTVGYQFSMYARRQAAYTLERWAPGSYDGFDNVITWGPYWEQVLRRWSQVYPEGYHLPGANKLSYGYRRLESERFSTRNILIPYEFWGNTRRIGQCMQKLMDRGWTVYFKFKPDEEPDRQLDCYELPGAYRERVVEVRDITDELMAEINVVAGGMTTLLYDLLPYGKHTWVFETEFRLLDDMVQDGLAEKIRCEDLDTLPDPGPADRQVDRAWLFNPAPLPEVLRTHVLARL